MTDIIKALSAKPAGSAIASSNPQNNVDPAGVSTRAFYAEPQADVAKAGVDIFRVTGRTPQAVAPSTTEQNTNALLAGIDLNNPQNEEQRITVDTVNQDRQNIEILARTRFTPEQIEGFKNNPIGFWESAHLALPFYSIGKQAYEAYNINDIGQKLEAGEQISQAEQETLNKFLDAHIEQQLRGTTIMGNISYGLSEMPAFMAEFALSGGVGRVAGGVALKGATRIAANAAVRGAARIGTNVAARTATVFSPHVALGYNERRITDSMSITDKGELIARESTESPAKSAMMAYGYTMAEVGSELSGAAIGRYVVAPVAGRLGDVAGRLTTPLISAVNNLPAGLRNAMYEAYKKIQPNAQVSRVFTAGGWNGMLEELGEERVNEVLSGFIGLAANDTQRAQDGQNYTSKDFFNAITPSPDQLLVEAGIIGIAGGTGVAANAAMNLMVQRGIDPAEAKDTVNNLSAIEQDNLLESLVIKPQSDYQLPMRDMNASAVANVRLMVNGQAVRAPQAAPIVGGLPTEESVNAELPVGIEPEPMASAPTDIKVVSDPIPESMQQETADLVKGGLYNVPQQALTLSYATGVATEQVHNDATAANQDAVSAMANAAMQEQERLAPPPINNDQSMSDRFITEFRNDLWPIHQLGEWAKKDGLDVEGYRTRKFSSVELTSRMYSSLSTQVQYAINHETFEYDQNGNKVITGKGLKPILDDFDNFFIAQERSARQRRADLKDYLIAQRYLQDLDKRDDVEVTDAQRATSAANIMRLQDKYGDNFQFFGTFAKEIYDFQKNVLRRLVVAGNLSEDQFNQITEKNPNYIPFRRVLDDPKSNLMATVSKSPLFSNARAQRVIKRIHGSDKEIKDPIASIIFNTNRVYDLALRNEVAVNIFNYKDIMPGHVQETRPPVIKTGTAKIKVTYDKKLREKLTQMIAFFENNLEFKKTLNRKGTKGFVRGEYSPMEKTVRLRLGTSDSVLTHEAGHMLDFAIGLRAKMLKTQKVRDELIKLADERLSTETKMTGKKGETTGFEDSETNKESQKFRDYLHNDYEVIANFFDGYVNAPDLVNKLAPTAKDLFEDIIDAQPELAFIKDIKPSLERSEETVEQDVWGESPIAPSGTITAIIDGKKRYALVSTPILKAAEHLSPSQMNLFERIFILPLSSIFRAGVTLTPEFMLRSLPREGLSAILTNRDIKYSAVDYAKGFASVISNAIGRPNDLYKEFSRSARFGSYQEMTEENIEKMYSQVISGSGNVMQYFTNPLKILEKVGMGVDQITRVGAFNAAKKVGFSDYEASLVSRDVFDYSRGGSAIKRANTWIPFLRAGINGSDKLYRASKERPVETAFWSLATITLPSMILTAYYLYQAPDEDRDEYLEIPENLRNLFWFYKQDGEWVRIPKPFQLGFAFGAIFENIMLWLYDTNRHEGAEFAKTLLTGVIQSVSPFADDSSLLPLVVKLPAEWASNYNFFFGKDIYPSFLDGKDPSQRTNYYTTETAKLIASGFDVSPALVDNAMRGMIGTSASYVTDIGDSAINAVKRFNGEAVPEKPITPSDVMIIRALAQRRPAGFRSNSYQVFSDRYKEVQQRRATSRGLDGEERQIYNERYRTQLSAYDAMSDAKEQISDLGKQLNQVYEDTSMNSQEKVDQINEIEDRITAIARDANARYIEITNADKE